MNISFLHCVLIHAKVPRYAQQYWWTNINNNIHIYKNYGSFCDHDLLSIRLIRVRIALNLLHIVLKGDSNLDF